MFTGIIEEKGKVRKIQRGKDSFIITIEADEVLTDLEQGASVSTNGVCLTVTRFNDREFEADVMPQTINKSNLGELEVGDPVNLESSLRVGDKLGGHFVSGHIDGVGEITGKKKEDNAVVFTIKPPGNLLKYIIPQGSIAVDGISLTVADLKEEVFSVSVIPHTAKVTNLGGRGIGDSVNLEGDMIGKYVARLRGVEKSKEAEKGIDRDLLQEKGFLLAQEGL